MVRDVKKFLQTLERFKRAFPKHKNDKIYGVVEGIKIDERVNEYAIQEGLFLIQPVGDSVVIANSHDFKPRTWQIEINPTIYILAAIAKNLPLEFANQRQND